MTTKITDGTGVEMQGPDSPALAAATARDLGGEARIEQHPTTEGEQESSAYLDYCDRARAHGDRPDSFEVWQRNRTSGTSIRGPRIPHLVVGSVGRVSPDQVGVPAAVSDEMTRRALTRYRDLGAGPDMDLRHMRHILEAALGA